MRNFEERKAEIFRRSEERVRVRKRRQKQLLGIGIPLVCAVLCLTVLLPGEPEAEPVEELYVQSTEAVTEDIQAEMQEPAYAESVKEDPHDCTGPCDCTTGAISEDEIPSGSEKRKVQVDEVGKYGSELENVYMELSNISLEEKRIDAFWRNHTGSTVFFGESYDIQRFTDGKWVSCATRLLDFPMPEYVLEGSSMLSITYTTNMEWFDLSLPGVYRITAEFTVDGGEETYALWAEFTLREEEESYEEETVQTCIVLPAAD